MKKLVITYVMLRFVKTSGKTRNFVRKHVSGAFRQANLKIKV